MISNSNPPPSFWKTVRLLLSASRKRSSARRNRQQQLLQQRNARSAGASDWGSLGSVIAALFMMGINIGAAFLVDNAVAAGQRVDAERHGKILVSKSFLTVAKNAQDARNSNLSWSLDNQGLDDSAFSSEAKEIAEHYGGKPAAIEQKLRDAYRNVGVEVFADKDVAAPGLSAFANSGPLPAFLGSLVLLWWAIMLICQGEGLEVDLQRRRHPVWEWLFSHPVPAGAVFMAEMMSPIAANPIYWGAPLFVGFLYGFAYGPAFGLLALLSIGVPITIATACMGKALEIAVMLRFSPRSRGAIIGLMGWAGFVSLMGFFFCLMELPKIITACTRLLVPLAALPSPWLRLFLGIHKDGTSSFLLGMFTCWLLATAMIATAVWFSVWGANRGLAGNFAMSNSRSAAPRHSGHFGKEPLYRKEYLWFIRDRSAIVQTILIPLTLAGLQAFNLRGIVAHAQGAWNYLCGGSILFGTYFLWVLGPKSLSSEGSALWIAQTWPRGLESLLKAKAWLWSLIASGIVALVLVYTVWLFPAEIWKIALVGVGWFIFSRSMADKAVTLVTVTSASGETEKVPRGRWFAAQLGMLTFSIGVITQQWHLAVIGIVYSYITAAAIWQNFRARLPFLDDPWSETLPPAPTLMHAMVAISILVEGGAVLTGIIVSVAGPQNIGVAVAIAYAICALAVALGTASFLSGRGVTTQEVWTWQPKLVSDETPIPLVKAFRPRDANFLLTGALGGAALGLLAHGYLLLVVHIPAAAEVIHKSQQQMAELPGLRVCYAITAIFFAPFAEEYLFRGLLYRALDREWGGWTAILGSAAFFAIYHPPLSWIPVGLLGIANAILFKKTGRLAPAVILHMVYNIVVLA